MPKMKTHKGVKKRFRKTGTGKLKHGRTSRRHLMNEKTAKRGRKMRKPAFVAKVDEDKVRRLMPYA